MNWSLQLVVGGARLGECDMMGRTALHHSIMCGHRNVVRFLLSHAGDSKSTEDVVSVAREGVLAELGWDSS